MPLGRGYRSRRLSASPPVLLLNPVEAGVQPAARATDDDLQQRSARGGALLLAQHKPAISPTSRRPSPGPKAGPRD